MLLQETITYSKVDISDFPDLYAIKTNTGKYFFCDKPTFKIISGLEEASARNALAKYYTRHYTGKDFPSILTNPSESEHVCTFVNHSSGKSLRAFSIAGLEFLCNNITGKVADKNRPKFLKLIQTFKQSIAAPRSPRPAAALGGRADEQQDLLEPMSPRSTQMIALIRGIPLAMNQLMMAPLQSQFAGFCATMTQTAQTNRGMVESLNEQVRELKAEKNIIENQMSVRIQQATETNDRQRYQISQLHKQRDQLIADKEALLVEKATIFQSQHSSAAQGMGAFSESAALNAKIAQLEKELKGQKAHSAMTHNQKEQANILRVRAETQTKELKRNNDELKRENKRLKRELDDWTGMATAKDRDSQ